MTCGTGGGDGGVGGGLVASHVRAGVWHACAVGDDKRLYCWGQNDASQTAPASTAPYLARATPVSVASSVEIADVAAGAGHTCALLTDNTVYCWGDNSANACGASPPDYHHQPSKVGSYAADQIVAGADFTCAVRSGTHAVDCWGNGYYASIGPTTIDKSATPLSVPNLGAVDQLATCPSCATVCARIGGSVKCWGGAHDTAYGTPVDLGVYDAADIAVGNWNSSPSNNEIVFILRSGGDGGAPALLYTHRSATGTFGVPQPYPGGEALATGARVAASDHLVVSSAGNVLWTYALPSDPQDTLPPLMPGSAPADVASLTHLTAGQGFFCVGTTTPGVQCYGSDIYGQLGDGSGSLVYSAARVASCTKGMYEGPNCTTIQLGDDSFRSFGECGAYYLDGQARLYPSAVPVLDQHKSTISFYRTGPEAPAVPDPRDEDRRAYFVDQSLGHIELVGGSQVTPLIPSTGEYLDLVLGDFWDLALRRVDAQTTRVELTALIGTTDPWGLFGKGNSEPITSGFQVTADGAAGIAGRRWADHACSWTAPGGALQCWGRNDDLQAAPLSIGDAAIIAPTTVLSAGVTQAAVGKQHTCAIEDKHVYCWGNNDLGQLGQPQPIMDPNDGTTRIYLQPNDGEVGKIAAGIDFTCAYVDAEQKVYCWGANGYGQCGNGSLQYPATPTPVDGLSGPVADLQAGGASACARLTNGDVYCWGASPVGQVGNGSAYEHSEWKRVVDF
jgi:alpha-tubulin suppressor-like RCC1 family protein